MKLIDSDTLQALSARALASARLRANHNLHAGPDDPVQRFCNAIEPASYIRPHRHAGDGRWELLLCLTGAMALLRFDDHGCVTQRSEIRAGGPVFGAEVPADTWHTIVALEPGSSMIEIKCGPYTPVAPGDFAPWSPAEGDARCAATVRWLHGAQTGMCLPREAG